jgi:hypothetical protein
MRRFCSCLLSCLPNGSQLRIIPFLYMMAEADPVFEMSHSLNINNTMDNVQHNVMWFVCWASQIHSTPSHLCLQDSFQHDPVIYARSSLSPLPSGSPNKECRPTHFSCPVHLILKLISLKTSGDECNHDLVIIRSFPSSCYFVLLSSEYSPQHPVLKKYSFINIRGEDSKLHKTIKIN